jgi:dihydrofolate synthase/folylpolyglutamate synthase
VEHPAARRTSHPATRAGVAARADEYLSFTKSEALHDEVLDARTALALGTGTASATRGGCLMIGTQSFVGIALESLGVETDTAYVPPPTRPRRVGISVPG